MPEWAQKEVIEGAREWEKYINLKFQFVHYPEEAHIRIANINIPVLSALGFMVGATHT